MTVPDPTDPDDPIVNDRGVIQRQVRFADGVLATLIENPAKDDQWIYSEDACNLRVMQ